VGRPIDRCKLERGIEVLAAVPLDERMIVGGVACCRGKLVPRVGTDFVFVVVGSSQRLSSPAALDALGSRVTFPCLTPCAAQSLC
jgi:hypothetical protein